jgi:hypothetical protein
MSGVTKLALAVSLALIVGCSDPPVPASSDAGPAGELTRNPSDLPPLPPPPSPQSTPPAPREGVATGNGNSDWMKETEQGVRSRAEAGVGVKGQRLEDEKLVRMIVAPARALFRTQQRLVFEVQIPQALSLYQALHGRYPATHEEFMNQIVAANQIQLPELPPGQRYVYDPETGELMVEKPAE